MGGNDPDRRLAERRKENSDRRAEQDSALAEVDSLRDEVSLLVDQLHGLRGTLAMFMPRSEAVRQMDRKVGELAAQMELVLEAEIRQSRDARRRTLARSAMAVLVAVLLAVTAQDLHVHNGHVGILEHRVLAIEDLIREVDATISEGRLPDLQSSQYETSHLPPMYPAAEQHSPPVGVMLYVLGLMGLLMLLWHDRQIGRNGRSRHASEDDEEDEDGGAEPADQS